LKGGSSDMELSDEERRYIIYILIFKCVKVEFRLAEKFVVIDLREVVLYADINLNFRRCQNYLSPVFSSSFGPPLNYD